MTSQKSRGETYRATLYQRAEAGDSNAKREIEVSNLRREADEAVSKLRDKAASGDPQAMSTLRRIANGSAPAAPAPAIRTGHSQADLDKAAADARRAERARFHAVFASEHSRGRERACVDILTGGDNWTAGQVIAKLPNISTDRELAAKDPATMARSDAAWDKANAAIGRDQPAPEADAKQTTRKTTSDPWERAYANVQGRR